MGAGRKKETLLLQNKPPPQHTSNQNPWSARNLRKKDLAAVIFGCKHSTFDECIFKQLFGLPALHMAYVQHVSPGMPLFLFNYSDRKLHGIFEATSYGQMCIDDYAWTMGGEYETAFPAQVRVKSRKQCQPISEELFKPIIADNYIPYVPNHFWFELDRDQTNKLISLFSSQSVTVPRMSRIMLSQEDCSSGNSKSNQKLVAVTEQEKRQENDVIFFEGKTWSSLFKAQTDPLRKGDDDSISEGVSNMSEDETPYLTEAAFVDEALHTPGALSDPDIHALPEVHVDDTPIASEVVCFAEEISSVLNSNYHPGLNKLIQAFGEMKAVQLDQTRKIQTLEQDLVEANRRIQELDNLHEGSGRTLLPLSTGICKERQSKRSFQISNHSILLVGGFSGSSWLRDLDLYIPFEDEIRSLEPMNSIRSYSSTVKHKDGLYVLGGGSNSLWFDTVESYNLKKGHWMTCPPLNRKKGNLAGVSFCDKIYAVGGGNDSGCFSEVEMFDMDIGKWVLTRSMVKKRFAPAAAQENGAIYVVGGYDGNEYLKSIERFDPREYSWTRLKSMSTRRGCHSLTVLNEKLYAIGGYNGAQMVPSVEVFEPRVGSWMMLEPMKYARGYMGCVTLGSTIYVIGGMQENGEILDTVECYSEGKGWQLADMKSIGKRGFFSAVAV